MDTLQPGSQPLHDALLERWGSDIVAGRLQPGTRIATEQAAAELGVSRTAVREVLRVLESLGLVAAKRRVGITVLDQRWWASLDSNVLRWRLAGPDRLTHLQSLSELRGAVEPLAARLAATHATPEQCGQLSAAVIGMSVTARAANRDDYLAHDTRFHVTLLEASANPVLAALTQVVTAVLHGRTRHDLMPATADSEALRMHGVAAAAVQSGDAAAAESALRAIVDESSSAMAMLAEDSGTGDSETGAGR